MNDFGGLGIDGDVIKNDGIESIELPSGCVCCTLRYDLLETLKNIQQEFSPERLYIEPSGVASPGGILEALAEAGMFAPTVVTIVDATEFLELHQGEFYGRFFTEQIEQADLILANKADLVEEDLLRKTVQTVEAINPRAVVTPAVQGIPENFVAEPRPVPGKSLPSAGHTLSFHTASYVLDRTVSTAALRHIFDELRTGTYGSITRAKALVQTDAGPYRADLSAGRVDMAAFGSAVNSSRVVVIGETLDRQALDKLFAAVSSPRS